MCLQIQSRISVLPVKSVSEPDIGDQYGTIVCERIGLSAPLYFGDNDSVLDMGIGNTQAAGFPEPKEQH